MKTYLQLSILAVLIFGASLACQKNYSLGPQTSLPATPTPTFTSTRTVTFTPTATSTCLGYFGNTSSAWVNQYLPNYLLVSPFTNNNNAAVTALMVYSSAAGNAQAGIYAAGASLPTNLIVASGTQACAVGWNIFPIVTTSLPPGSYWLAVDTDTTGTSVSTSPGTKNSESWTFGTFPANFGSALGSYPYNMSIEALYYCY